MKNEWILPGYYASVLFNLSLKSHAEESYLKDLQDLSEILLASEPLRKFMRSPFIFVSEKRRVIESLFKRDLPSEVLYFIEKLIDCNRFDLIPRISVEYKKKWLAHQGKFVVQVVVPKSLDTSERNELTKKLSSFLKGEVTLEEKVDPQLIGGMTLYFANHKMIDFSLREKLERLKELLSKGHSYATKS